MKFTKQCPECSGREIYTTTSRVEMLVGLLPHIGSPFVMPEVEIYVCGQCGHHQVFVPQEYLPKVKRKYELYK